MKRTKKEKRDNPYLSDAEHEERLAFAKRTRQIKWAIAVGALVIVLVIVLFFRFGPGP